MKWKMNDTICAIIVVLVMFFLSLAISNHAAAQADMDIGQVWWMPSTTMQRMLVEQNIEKNALKAEAEVVEYVVQKIDTAIGEMDWCFSFDCSNQENVNILGNILKKYGWTVKTYGIQAAGVERLEVQYIELKILLYSKINPDGRYMKIWYLQGIEDRLESEGETPLFPNI